MQKNTSNVYRIVTFSIHIKINIYRKSVKAIHKINNHVRTNKRNGDNDRELYS